MGERGVGGGRVALRGEGLGLTLTLTLTLNPNPGDPGTGGLG